MEAQTCFDTRIVGALPAIVHYLGRLDLAATINRLVPWKGDAPLGTLVEVMVANRLLQPRALFRIGQWSEATAVTDYFSLTADQLNDDHLGLALERLAEHALTIQSALVLEAIEQFEFDVYQIHYDLTTVALYGAYEAEAGDGQPPTPRPAYGRTKSGRRHVEQVQLGFDVTGDGGVPVGYLRLDGNAGEVTSHLENTSSWPTPCPGGSSSTSPTPSSTRPGTCWRSPPATVSSSAEASSCSSSGAATWPCGPNSRRSPTSPTARPSGRLRSVIGTRPSRWPSTWRGMLMGKESGWTTAWPSSGAS